MDTSFEQKKPKVETPRDKILNLLSGYANQINEDSGMILVDEQGRLIPENFSPDLYEEGEIANDVEHVRRLEIRNATLDNPKVRAFKCPEAEIDPKNLSEEDITELLVQYERRKQYDHVGSQAEVVIPMVLTKVLGTKYLIVRTTYYDDYEAGVDHLIIDKETGAVICAIDEVAADQADNRTVKKEERAVQRAQKGGTTVKYGLTFENSVMIMKRLDHLLTFILPISKNDLSASLKELLTNSLGAASANVYDNLRRALQEQVAHLKQAQLSPIMQTKLQEFEEILDKLPTTANFE